MINTGTLNMRDGEEIDSMVLSHLLPSFRDLSHLLRLQKLLSRSCFSLSVYTSSHPANLSCDMHVLLW